MTGGKCLFGIHMAEILKLRTKDNIMLLHTCSTELDKSHFIPVFLALLIKAVDLLPIKQHLIIFNKGQEKELGD